MSSATPVGLVQGLDVRPLLVDDYNRSQAYAKLPFASIQRDKCHLIRTLLGVVKTAVSAYDIPLWHWLLFVTTGTRVKEPYWLEAGI